MGRSRDGARSDQLSRRRDKALQLRAQHSRRLVRVDGRHGDSVYGLGEQGMAAAVDSRALRSSVDFFFRVPTRKPRTARHSIKLRPSFRRGWQNML